MLQCTRLRKWGPCGKERDQCLHDVCKEFDKSCPIIVVSELSLLLPWKVNIISATLQKEKKIQQAFDAVVTFSSIEHSGLGRYGDSLNPWGDLIASAQAWWISSIWFYHIFSKFLASRLENLVDNFQHKINIVFQVSEVIFELHIKSEILQLLYLKVPDPFGWQDADWGTNWLRRRALQHASDIRTPTAVSLVGQLGAGKCLCHLAGHAKKFLYVCIFQPSFCPLT